jgi:FkbM family methyltransferase
MLSWIVETKTVWEHLKETAKPILLYGMGNGADRILDKCLALDIPVAGVFASDEFVRGQTFRSYKVQKYSDIEAKYKEFVIVIAFASERPEILTRFFAMAKKQETYAPHVAIFHGDDLVSFSWLKEHEAQLTDVYENLADDLSRQVFADVLNYKISGKMCYLERVTSRRQDLTTLFNFTEQECYGDLGAYKGDTITEFLELTKERYQHIYAVEPDKKNYVKLKDFVEQEQLSKLTLINSAIWSESGRQHFYQRGGRMSSLAEAGTVVVPVLALDDLKKEQPFTYLKFDVEGAEKEALLGAKNILSAEGPKLLVAAYHHDNDLWELPEIIHKMNPHYKIYLRRHPYVPCWEINICALIEDNGISFIG